MGEVLLLAGLTQNMFWEGAIRSCYVAFYFYSYVYELESLLFVPFCLRCIFE